jgi:hypothetical protein
MFHNHEPQGASSSWLLLDALGVAGIHPSVGAVPGCKLVAVTLSMCSAAGLSSTLLAPAPRCYPTVPYYWNLLFFADSPFGQGSIKMAPARLPSEASSSLMHEKCSCPSLYSTSVDCPRQPPTTKEQTATFFSLRT